MEFEVYTINLTVSFKFFSITYSFEILAFAAVENYTALSK